MSLHKPGFRVGNTVTRDRSIYDAYDAEVAGAYKNVGTGESEFRDHRISVNGINGKCPVWIITFGKGPC